MANSEKRIDAHIKGGGAAPGKTPEIKSDTNRSKHRLYTPKLGDWFPLPHGRPEELAEYQKMGPVAWLEGIVKARREFEFAEHSHIGDFIGLQWTEKIADKKYKTWNAGSKPFILPNGLSLTYGQLNGLSGDFYGPNIPISDGADLAAQQKSFMELWYWLAEDTTQTPDEAPKILNLLCQEVTLFNKALKCHEDPLHYYKDGIQSVNAALTLLTLCRSGHPGYAGLAAQNWDHFGEHAMTAYCAGHAAAMAVAAEGTDRALLKAYAMNACADHFLEDMFSSGHMRTPRKELHGGVDSIFLDLCAKAMHDEDSISGLKVFNKDPKAEPKEWRAFGDKRLKSKDDNSNWTACLKAIQASADEIHEAWRCKQVKPASEFAAHLYAPQLINDAQNQKTAPLFKADLSRRKNVSDKKTWEFEPAGDWWGWSTLGEIEFSQWWNGE